MVLAQMSLRSAWRKALVIAVAIPLSVAKNGLRIFVLAMLTTVPAELFHLSQHEGKAVPGMKGDLTILSEDPASGGPEAFTKIRYTIRGGKVIRHRREYRTHRVGNAFGMAAQSLDRAASRGRVERHGSHRRIGLYPGSSERA